MQTVALLFDHGSEVATISHTYDGMGRLTQIKHGDIAQYDFSWDVANRITSMNDAEYGYDQTSQLVSAEYETLPEELYEYDANGNRKAFETGKNNQLLSDGVFDYKYDDEGNRVAKVSTNSKTEYFWDHRNRLVKVVDNGKAIVYNYDYQNRLVRRNDELFVHDGWQIALTLDAKGKVKNRHLWGATQDELLAMDDQWALRDHLNTVRKVVDAKGKVVSELEYNAFGVLVNATGEKPLFRYTGKMFDDATGLQWNVNRWYDANIGRWVSEDPIGFEGRDGNLVRYCGNAALVAVDSHGLKWVPKLYGDDSVYQESKPVPPTSWWSWGYDYLWHAIFRAEPYDDHIYVMSASMLRWEFITGSKDGSTAYLSFDYDIYCSKNGHVMIKNANANDQEDEKRSDYDLYVATAVDVDIDRWDTHYATIVVGFGSVYARSSAISITVNVPVVSVTYTPGNGYSQSGRAQFEYECVCDDN